MVATTDDGSIKNISDLLQQLAVQSHLYADDTQFHDSGPTVLIEAYDGGSEQMLIKRY